MWRSRRSFALALLNLGNIGPLPASVWLRCSGTAPPHWPNASAGDLCRRRVIGNRSQHQRLSRKPRPRLQQPLRLQQEGLRLVQWSCPFQRAGGSAVFGGNAGHEDDAVAAFDSATTSTKNNTVSLAVFIIAMLSKPCAWGASKRKQGSCYHQNQCCCSPEKIKIVSTAAMHTPFPLGVISD
jgi:hypothetical protein